MNRLILAFALLLGGAQQSCAETPDCLPNPTRACVFQMALRQADDEDRSMFLASGYLAVAYLQEQEQTGDAAQTRTALLAKLLHDYPDPAVAHQALNAAASVLSFSDVPLGDTPETDQWLRTALADLSRQAGLPPDDFSTLKPEALKASIRAKVTAAPADPLPRFARLGTKRGPEMTRLDMRIVGISSVLTWEHSRLLIGLFAKGALTGAQAEIATWTDPNERTNGHAALALAYARAGQIGLALTLARSPELNDLALLDYEAKRGLVEVWARAGARRNDILPSTDALAGTPEFQPEFQARITVAMVMGDITTAHDLLATIKPWHRDIAAIQGIDAALEHDPGRVQALVALFPREEQAELLYRLGEAQIRVGDVQGVFATIDQLATVPDPINSAHILRGLLAPVLAATGRGAEAVRLAADLGDAKVTALVAARLE